MSTTKHEAAREVQSPHIASSGEKFQNPLRSRFTTSSLDMIDASEGGLIDYTPRTLARRCDGYFFDIGARGNGTHTAALHANGNFWNLAIARFSDDAICRNSFD